VVDNKKIFTESKITINEDWQKDVLVVPSFDGESFVLNITLLAVSTRAYMDREKYFDLRVFVTDVSSPIIPTSSISRSNSRNDEPAKFTYKWKAASESSHYYISFCGCILAGTVSARRPSENTLVTAEIVDSEQKSNIFSKMMSKLGAGKSTRVGKAGSRRPAPSDLFEGKSISTQTAASLLCGKVLMLGTGLCGKSIIAKQIQKFFTQLSTEQYIPMIDIIHSNIVDSMKDLLKNNSKLHHAQGRIFELSPVAKKAKKALQDYFETHGGTEGEFGLTPEVGQHINTLWGDPGIKVTFERSPPEHFSADAISFYLDNVTRITSEDYMPTEEDIMHSYVRTSGILKQKYVQDNVEVHFVDIGGQTVYRKKWAGLVNGQILISSDTNDMDYDEKIAKEKEPKLSGVIYVVSIGEYDQRCWHDKNLLTLKDSLSAFEQIYKMPQLLNVPLYLIFNKMDLFEKKINKIPLTVCFPDWSGAATVDNMQLFIQEKFRALLPLEKTDVYFYSSNALDFSSIQGTIRDILDKTKDFLEKREDEGGNRTTLTVTRTASIIQEIKDLDK
jgi:GTPase SAR1 family protein